MHLDAALPRSVGGALLTVQGRVETAVLDKCMRAPRIRHRWCSAPAFNEQFEQAQYSIFRLETLAHYGGSGEERALAAFLAGDVYAAGDDMRHWMELIQRNAQAGCVMRRVHVVTEPLSDYLRFEITWGNPYSVSAGEDVRLIAMLEGAVWPADVPQHDFWMYDGR